MKKAAFCTILLSVAMFLFGTLPAAAAPRYTYKQVCTLWTTLPQAINAFGQVVGQNDTQAFLWSGGVLQDLGTLLNSLVNLPGVNLYTAYGINDRGQILANSSVHGYLLTPVSSLAAVDLLLLD